MALVYLSDCELYIASTTSSSIVDEKPRSCIDVDSTLSQSLFYVQPFILIVWHELRILNSPKEWKSLITYCVIPRDFLSYRSTLEPTILIYLRGIGAHPAQSYTFRAPENSISDKLNSDWANFSPQNVFWGF